MRVSLQHAARLQALLHTVHEALPPALSEAAAVPCCDYGALLDTALAEVTVLLHKPFSRPVVTLHHATSAEASALPACAPTVVHLLGWMAIPVNVTDMSALAVDLGVHALGEAVRVGNRLGTIPDREVWEHRVQVPVEAPPLRGVTLLVLANGGEGYSCLSRLKVTEVPAAG